MSKIHTPAEAVEILNNGGVGVLPTDTLYGLVARIDNHDAVSRLYALKHREQRPGTVIAANIEQLKQHGIKARYLKAVEQFWPGPVSVELPAGDSLTNIQQNVPPDAYRVVDNEELVALLEQTGPLVTSSANLAGEPPSNTVADAQAYFGDKVDFYVDGGDLSGRAPSTVIKLADDAVVVKRQGAVEISESGEIISRHGCPFCRKNDLLQGEVLAKSRTAYCISVKTFPGNFLIIPNHHAERIDQLSDGWWHEFKELIPQIPGLTPDYNISLNIGKHAGQTVKHLHFWIIPRQPGLPSSGKGMARLLADVNDGTK